MMEEIIWSVIGVAVLFYGVRWVRADLKECEEIGDLLGQMYLNSRKHEAMMRRRNKR